MVVGSRFNFPCYRRCGPIESVSVKLKQTDAKRIDEITSKIAAELRRRYEGEPIAIEAWSVPDRVRCAVWQRFEARGWHIVPKGSIHGEAIWIFHSEPML